LKILAFFINFYNGRGSIPVDFDAAILVSSLVGVELVEVVSLSSNYWPTLSVQIDWRLICTTAIRIGERPIITIGSIIEWSCSSSSYMVR